LRNLLFHETGTLPARSRFLASLRNDKGLIAGMGVLHSLVVVPVGVVSSAHYPAEFDGTKRITSGEGRLLRK
jgi:hypothetical protein